MNWRFCSNTFGGDYIYILNHIFEYPVCTECIIYKSSSKDEWNVFIGQTEQKKKHNFLEDFPNLL